MSARHRRVAVLAVVLLTLTAACAESSDDGATEGAAQATAPEALGHVHGIGTDPADGTVYAATHYGVFDLGKDGAGPAERVADRWQDTMAFTVVGPGHFLASGHPDQREDLPVHLGLLESTDGARTWDPLSLLGEADFHALEASEDLLYGYDSVTGRLLVTSDRRDWRALDQVQVADLAADPREPGRVLATTPEGILSYRADGGSGTRLEGAPPLALLDWPTADLLVGITGDGVVHRSRDAGQTWQRLDGPPGSLQALDVAPGRWFVATDTGLYRSDDDGRNWQRLPGA